MALSSLAIVPSSSAIANGSTAVDGAAAIVVAAVPVVEEAVAACTGAGAGDTAAASAPATDAFAVTSPLVVKSSGVGNASTFGTVLGGVAADSPGVGLSTVSLLTSRVPVGDGTWGSSCPIT